MPEYDWEVVTPQADPKDQKYDWEVIAPASPENAKNLAKSKWDALGKENTVSDSGHGASITSALFASLFPSQQDQIGAYSKARGIDPSRYGVDPEGNIGFINEKSQFVREVPHVTWSDPKSLVTWAAANMRPLADQAVGTVAGIVTAPFGGGVPGAMGAAGATDAGLQALGKAIDGKSPLDISYFNAAGQGALAGAGQGIANGVTGLARGVFDKNPLKAAGFDAERFSDPEQLKAIQDISQKAQNIGVTLMPGEATGAKSLLVRQRQMGRMDNTGTGKESPMDILDEAYKVRNTQEVPGAVQNFAQTISGTPGTQDAAKNGAQGILDGIVKNARDTGAKYYQDAFAKGGSVDTQPILEQINQAKEAWPRTSQQYRQLEQVRRLVASTDGPNGNLQALHGAKMELDLLPTKDPNVGADSILSGQLEGIANSVRDGLVKASPEYAQGNAAYVKALAPLDDLKGGIVGKIANGQATVGSLIKSANPFQVAQVRNAFVDNGQGQAWNDALRGHIEDVLDGALKNTQAGSPSNVAGKVAQGLGQSPKAEANLKMAINDPAKVKALEDMMDVFRAAAKAPAEGSPTASDLGKNGVDLAGPVQKLAATVLAGVKFWDVPEKIANVALTQSGADNAVKLAKLFTEPDVWATIQKMRMMSPNSAAYIRTGTKVLEDIGYGANRASGTGFASQLPAVLQQPADPTRLPKAR